MFNRLRCLMRVTGTLMFALPRLLFSQADGSALGLDGVDDYVQVPDNASLDMTSGVTIAAWIYLDSYTEWASLVTKGGLLDDGGAITPNNYTVHQSGPSAASGEYGHLRFTSNLGLAGDSQSLIPLHEWHHVAVTFDGEQVRFFLDGRPDGVVSFVGQLQPNDDPLHIGVDFPGDDEYWHGCLDELMIFNRALSRKEIRDLKDDDREFNSRTLVGFWRFNEGKGEVAHDRSRRRNHGQLFGNPAWKEIDDDARAHPRFEAANELLAPLTLLPNYPNPFNPETEIRFHLGEASHVVVKIFNIIGEEVRTLADEPCEVGYHRVHWDGKDKSGQAVASGTYLYQLRAGSFSQVKKMNLLR